jgi:hypothetical protein
MSPAPPAESRITERWPLAYVGIAAVALALITLLALYLMRGSHLELRGSIRNVRTVASDETHTIAIADFDVTNVADYPFVVRTVTLSLAGPDGKMLEGTTVAEIDARRVFEYYPQLGAKNDTLLSKETVAPHQTKLRMIAAQFELPEAAVKQSRRLNIRIRELDGAESEIEKRLK